MLQAIHDNLKGIFAFIILGVLSVVFIFWGVEFVSVGALTGSQGIEVNGEPVDAAEVRQTYQQQLSQYQAAFRGSEVPEEIRRQIQQDVLDSAISEELVRQRTDELRFRASDADVVESLKGIPQFQLDGKFDRDAYLAALRSVNLEPAAFEAQQRRFVAARQLDRGLSATAFVLPGEFERRQALLGESREIGWMVVPASRFLGAAKPDEAAIEAYYQDHTQDYQTAETANVQFVELDLATLTEQVAVTEEALLQFYNDHLDRYTTPERRRASHILITAEGGDEAGAEARAVTAYQRASGGEDFAALAKELSQDPGSAAQGGDLGWSERSFFVKPFADAVWSLAPGEISKPVRTEFGWHVIRLEGVEGGAQRSFDEVRAELEPEYRRAEAEQLFGDLQEQLDTEAFEAGADLQRVAESMGLEVQSVPGFTRTGGGVLGGSPDLIATVFQPDVLSGQSIRTVELAPGRIVAVKVVAHQPPRDRPLDEVREDVTAALAIELARKAAQDRAEALAASLREGANWEDTTRDWVPAETADDPSTRLRFVQRDAVSAPPAVTQAVFKAPPPKEARVYGTVELGSGDVAVWALAAVRPGASLGLAPAQRAQAMREAREAATIRDSAMYLTELRAAAKIEVNPQLFE